MSERVVVGRDSMGRPIRRSDPYVRVMERTERIAACLVFTGHRNRYGYGRVSDQAGGSTLAHRIVWRHHHPDAPEPPVVMHLCDNPPCVEITHLRAGNHADNSADMVQKGRSPDTRGERSGRAKLRDRDVDQMRALAYRGARPSQLAEMFSVDASYVSRLLRDVRRPSPRLSSACQFCGAEITHGEKHRDWCPVTK